MRCHNVSSVKYVKSITLARVRHSTIFSWMLELGEEVGTENIVEIPKKINADVLSIPYSSSISNRK